MSGRGLNTYRQTQVQSRTPLELVVMLYDGALVSLSSARAAIERRDIASRRDSIGRALAIISELQSTLNLEQGGEVAAQLDDLYEFASRRLLDATIKNEVTPVDEVTRVFTTLRDAWQTIAAAPVATAAGQRA
ncbi:MAG TPA: flagellar export chaperone FliS [Vicinamibacterales bacterium]|nr:flagellar export chaperone FliS [Vicinamibacterales bacterium]